MASLETTLALVRDGRIGFEQLMTDAQRQFRAMAAYLARRWTPPAWMTLEDIEQELYLGAWKHLWEWEEGRGPSLGTYVVYNSISSAKRSLHKARGAKLSGSPDKNPSRIEKPLSVFPEGEALAAAMLAEDPVQEEALILAEDRDAAMKRAFEACETSRERVAVLAIIEGGSIEGGAAVLYDDMRTRVALRLGSEKHAERWVFREAHTAMERLSINPG